MAGRPRRSMENIPDYAKSSFARSLFAEAAETQYDAIDNVMDNNDNSRRNDYGGRNTAASSSLRGSEAMDGLAPLPPNSRGYSSPRTAMRHRPQSSFARRRSEQRSSIAAAAMITSSSAATSGISGMPSGMEEDEDWSHLLKSSVSQSNSHTNPTSEQDRYRNDAQTQAARRVLENMGYDPRTSASHNPSQTTNPAPSPATRTNPLFQKGPPPTEGAPLPSPSPSLPTSLPSRPITSQRFFRHHKNDMRIPELCPGMDLNVQHDAFCATFPAYDSSGYPLQLRKQLKQHGVLDDQTVVKCLNCLTLLKVKKLASLVRCPRCSTVSPVTSIIGPENEQ
uniref:Uncharacterized protein n=1 Tax=Ditylum brightwellii TaxID=49249 RepID=A0A6V2KTM4_9STRA|mmetsp:Transcript_27780/g.41632  ORF Transcript_27780/g.41632 Transcript_27780/m.41632 type:complete len:337 (-) Transcript_27780:53-1063(-)